MNSRLPISLPILQSVCKKVEEEMLLFLLQYAPCDNLQVCDVKSIARFARDQAFKAFDEACTELQKRCAS